MVYIYMYNLSGTEDAVTIAIHRNNALLFLFCLPSSLCAYNFDKSVIKNIKVLHLLQYFYIITMYTNLNRTILKDKTFLKV